MPCRSSSRSVCVSIFCEMPPARRPSSPLRTGPSPRMHSNSIDHLLPMSARMPCDGQLALNGFAFFFAMEQAPEGTYLSIGGRQLNLAGMWTDNSFTQRLRLDAPVVQGPFGGGLSAVDLVVAVSESGGLGSFGVHHLGADGIRDVAAKIRARTGRPFALNLWIPLRDSDDPRMSDAQWQQALELLAPYF